MSEEEKGFVIKDKRSFDEKGELREDAAEVAASPEEATEAKETTTSREGADTRSGEKTERPPLPEVNFTSLIFSLSSSALFHLGEIADPQTGKRARDLPLAKHTIDTIAMLKEKTTGNLTDEERKFLDSVLDDMRWRYVKAVG